MPGLIQELTNFYHEQLQRHKNYPFLKATMAACALVAIADGKVSFAQRIRVDQVLEGLDQLKVFDPHEGVNLFNEYVEEIQSSPEKGREKALAVILEQAANPDTAALLLRICVAISSIGNEISKTEQIEIVSLCGHMNIEPKECGLYTDSDPKVILDNIE